MKINNAITLLEKKETNSILKKKLKIFLDAINDFPIEVNSFEEYFFELQNALSSLPNKKSLKQKLVTIDFSKDAWIAESISTILEIYNFYTCDLSLDQIIKELNIECNYFKS